MSSEHNLNREFICVLVADSNQTQSQLMCGALGRDRKLRVNRCRAELSDCLRQLKVTPSHVVLINDSVPGADHQFDLLRGIHAAYPDVGLILVLSKYDRDFVVNAIRYGARGLFRSAEEPFKQLRRCIEAVHHGQIWVNTEQLGYLVEALAAPSIRLVNSSGHSLLTSREEQTVSRVAEGMSNRQIAEQLSIKESTVKKSLLRIYDKLGISNRVELVLYALTQRDNYRSDVQHSRPVPTAPPSESHHVHRGSNPTQPTGRSGSREEVA